MENQADLIAFQYSSGPAVFTVRAFNLGNLEIVVQDQRAIVPAANAMEYIRVHGDRRHRIAKKLSGAAVFREIGGDLLEVCWPKDEPRLQIPYRDVYEAMSRLDAWYTAKHVENFRFRHPPLRYGRLTEYMDGQPLSWD
jgi:hypothetical protein